MKKRDLDPWFHETARLLGLRLDDTDRRSPTYPGDGRLCIARLKKPSHVVHEYAHFIEALPWRRYATNYGLGTDPDGGPFTAYAGELDEASGGWCEVSATFLTLILLGEAGLPWLQEARAKRWCDPKDELEALDQQERVDLHRRCLEMRGIDVFDVTAHFRAGDPER